jgi:hypothetical protein
LKIKDVMGTDPPPVLDNGQQVCLSFHWTPQSTHGSSPI